MSLAVEQPRRKLWRPSRQQLPLVTTCIVCLLLYAIACYCYPKMLSVQVILNLVSENAYLGVVAIGMTVVILSGGIDLSVGSIVACSTIVMAVLVENRHWNPFAAMALVLVGGVLVGAGMGCLIQFFELPPFLVTLGGLFFFRGLGLYISLESIGFSHPLYEKLASMEIPLGHEFGLPLTSVIFLVMLLIAIYVLFFTRFGRNVYAIGGSESSALLMGLPVQRTKIGIYAVSGFCSSLAGILVTIYKTSGDANSAMGLELDAIATVVVGGALLTGGVGYVAGTFVGLLIFGTFQTAILFDGRPNPAWNRIVVGLLLFVFILLQKLLQFGKGRE